MNTLTLSESSRVSSMTPDAFESVREAGYAYRCELTHAVMRGLDVPTGWQVNGEYQSEFGGWFPVQVRFTPPGGGFRVEVCSPGEISPVWLVVVVCESGRTVSVVRSLAQFDGRIISHVISLAAALNRDGYRLNDILATLGMEGGL